MRSCSILIILLFALDSKAGMPVTDVTHEFNRILDRISLAKSKIDILSRYSHAVESGKVVQEMARTLDSDLLEIEQMARTTGANTNEIRKYLITFHNSSSGLNQRIQIASNILDNTANIIKTFVDSPEVETAKSARVTAIGVQEVNQNLHALQAQQLKIELENKKEKLRHETMLRQETQDTYIQASTGRKSSLDVFKSMFSFKEADSFKNKLSKNEKSESIEIGGLL